MEELRALNDEMEMFVKDALTSEFAKVLLHNIPRTTRFMFCVIRPVIHILIMKMVR